MHSVTRLQKSYYGDRMNAKLLTIGVVAILVIAGVSAYVLLKKDSEFQPDAYPDTYLTILGNAEYDNVIDVKDKDKINALVNSGKSIEYKDYYMYDANYDGKIDAEDAEFVQKIIDALASADPKNGDSWKNVGTVHYVNVDKKIASYDMTKSNKVITLIAPPLDSVLAMGGKDLVVGFDSRIEKSGKYYPEYANTLDYTNPYLVGSCNDPRTEVISQAANDLGSVTVVCGNQQTYGPNMEGTFKGTNVQVVRIASWEYGETMYGFMTLGFLLKMNDGAKAYFDQYKTLEDEIKSFIDSVPAEKKVGAAVVYGYDMESREVKLLGKGTGEYSNLMQLQPYDSAEAYLGGVATGGHGNQINGEAISSMVQNYQLKKLIILIGTPFQVKTAEGNAESTQEKIKQFYDHWEDTFGLDTMSGLEYCIAGYSFSSGVSEVLNRLILSYYLYHEEFVAAHTDEAGARAYIQEKVDWYCKSIGIQNEAGTSGWTFNGSADYGMNLLYCGDGDARNIMNGATSGSNPYGF